MFKSINKVIRILIFSDLALNGAWGLIGPIFAIFVVQKIAAGSAIEGAKIAGFASLTYWIVKSILQIPIGRYLDKNRGEKDDFWFMVFGTFLTGLTPFGFMIASRPWHIYGFQILHAIGMAMVIPSWSAIFTRHIDKGKEAFEWGLESTSLGFGAGIAGAIGGILVAIFGFKVVFILVGTFTIISACILLLIHKEIAPRDKLFPRIPPFRMPF
ncbi:MFS transporter [Patescibacteria group bacterium]|nr:MFS transporter [Patescibacteria group bacterium]